MTVTLVRWVSLLLLSLFFVGCATTSSVNTPLRPSGIHLSFSPLTDPPLPAKGRMLIRPFTDHHSGGSQNITGIRDPIGIDPEQSLAGTLSDAFAEASRFAGYEVKLASEAPVGFQPDVMVEGSIDSCQMGTSSFGGMFVTNQRLSLQIRMSRPGQDSPIWQGRIVGSAGNFLRHNVDERLATYETMFKDSINSAMQEWVQALNPQPITSSAPNPAQLTSTSAESKAH